MTDDRDRILVLDDDAQVRSQAAGLLVAAGYAVQTAAGGAGGLGLLRTGPAPSAVVVDYRAPGLPGEAVVGAIRSWHPDVALVAWSDVLTERTCASLLAGGATACLPRADLGAYLVPLLERLLAARRERRRLAERPASSAPRAGRDPEEERENTRYRVSMPVAVQAPGWGEFAIFYTDDVSRGGLFIRMVEPLAVGGLLLVRLGAPDGRVIQIGTEIAHVATPANPRGKPAGVGVRFVQLSGEQRSAMAAIVAALVEVAAGPARPAPRPQARAPRAAPAGGPAPGGDAGRDVAAQLAEIQGRDHFAALGLPRGTDPQLVPAAFRRLARCWHPSVHAFGPDAERSAATEIFLRLREARAILADPTTSSSYAARLPRPRPSPGPVPPPAAIAPTEPRAAPPPVGMEPTEPRAMAAPAPPPPATGASPPEPRPASAPTPGPRVPEPMPPRPRPPAPRPGATPARRLLAPLAGILHNPTDLGELAKLPIQRNAPLTETPPSSLVGLLRWLARHEACGILTLGAPRELRIPLCGGRVLLEEQEFPLAVQAASLAEVAYAYEPKPENEIAKSCRGEVGWAFVASVVKRLVYGASFDQLQAALPAHRAPRLHPEEAGLLQTMRLTPAEKRFVASCLDGARELASLYPRAGLSQLATARLLCFLTVLGLLEWVEPAGDRPETRDSVRAAYERLATGNLFDVIGSHYSAAPARLRAAYEQVIRGYGPGTPAHQQSPELAHKVVAEANRAWATLRERVSRRRYRAQELGMNVASAANVLAQGAKMALMRGQTGAAREALAAAFDLDPRPEYLGLWRSLGASSDGTFSPGDAEVADLADLAPARVPPPTRPPAH
ncbi:MAG: DnaJ domain-containing protein [Deltaproteobacteria bacterium]|nr:DnaJ domain-containing protein [Deltaproteobacteria bacterium]